MREHSNVDSVAAAKAFASRDRTGEKIGDRASIATHDPEKGQTISFSLYGSSSYLSLWLQLSRRPWLRLSLGRWLGL